MRDAAGRRRAGHLRGHRGDDHDVEVRAVEPGVVERGGEGLNGQLEGPLNGLVDPASFADAGPLNDPLVGGVDHLLQIGVGQHALGHRRADAGETHPE